MFRHGRVSFVVLLAVVFAVNICGASVFGTIKAVVHDPQHRPMAGANVVLKAKDSSWTRAVVSDGDGIAQFASVPIGEYEITIMAKEFKTEQLAVTAGSDRGQGGHVARRGEGGAPAVWGEGKTAAGAPTSA